MFVKHFGRPRLLSVVFGPAHGYWGAHAYQVFYGIQRYPCTVYAWKSREYIKDVGIRKNVWNISDNTNSITLDQVAQTQQSIYVTIRLVTS